MNVVNVVPMHPSSPPPSSPNASHVAVLKSEVIAALDPQPGGIYLDVTLGAGGHSAALLDTSSIELIGTDRDRSALALAQRRLRRFGARVRFHQARFSELPAVLRELGVERVDGLLADLGLSSMQLGDAGRGMSFRQEGPIDMRMDREEGRTARELIAALSTDDLAEIILRFGEEKRARRVAKCIHQALAAGQLQTTLDLRRAIVQAVGPARIGGIDPATRAFQALRMAVNDELGELQALLTLAPAMVSPGGRIAVISFHSLEDRMVKRALGRAGLWQPLSSKPITPTEEEMDENPRARSAKLRAARRTELAVVAQGEP